MPPVQGTGKAPNISNPNMPSTATPKSPSKPTSKAPSVADPAESATAVAKNDPAKAIEKLETRTKAVNANNVARVANSHLTTNDEKLHPLVALKTGKPLEKFPETSKDIAKLTRKFGHKVDGRIALLAVLMEKQ
jgi:heme-binding NEAT domain protein